MAEYSELEQLKEVVEQLRQRVTRLERMTRVGPPIAEQVAAPVPVEPAVPPRSAPPPPPGFELPIPTRRTSKLEEPTLESRIGSQWFNRVGIIAVLVGISYFLKYAFENNWIGPGGRVSIGLLAGIAIVVWSERFRRQGHRAFSFSLKAIGIGALYLSLWAALQVYHLVPSEAAFAAMVVVTAATATLALTQDAPVLAAFALTGGFATPLLLSTGVNREITLFSYVALLDVGTLALVVFRPWVRLLAGAFVGTLVLYIGWYAEFYTRAQLAPTLAFAALFFAIFAVAVLVMPVRAGAGRRLPELMLALPLLNATGFFLELYVLLHDISKPALAWTAVLLAGAYLVLSRQVRARAPLDEASAKVLYLMHVALAVGFLTTAIPLKLETHWITIGWLVESAVLLYIGYRTVSDFLKFLATAALVLGVFRLVVVDNFNPQTLLLNARFATYLVAIGAIAWGVSLARKGATDTEQSLAAVGAVAINVLAIVSLSSEVGDYFNRSLAVLSSRGSWESVREQYGLLQIARGFTYSALCMVYGAVLMWLGFRRRSAFLRWQAMALLIVTIGKVFMYDVLQLERGYRIISFIGLGVLLLAISFVYQRDWLKLSRRAEDDAKETSPSV